LLHAAPAPGELTNSRYPPSPARKRTLSARGGPGIVAGVSRQCGTRAREQALKDTGRRRRAARSAARELRAGSDTLYRRRGHGYRAASMKEVVAHARRLLARQLYSDGPILSRPGLVETYLRLQLASQERACFAMVLLDRRKRVIACLELFHGTIDRVSVHPREVVREAVLRNAASVIFARNEPCGCAKPTGVDKLTCARLVEALDLVDIPVLDYLIIGKTTTSLRKKGMSQIHVGDG